VADEKDVKILRGMKLTSAGLNILSQGLLGAQLLFPRVGLGDGDFDYETESVLEIKEMRRWQKDLPITEMKIVGNGEVVFVCKQTNSDVVDGFWCKEYGVFAIDPADGKEKLYSYVNFGDESSYLPNNLGPVIEDLKIGITTVIRNATNVVAVLDESFAYTAQGEFKDHINSDHPHPNTPNHYADVTDADNFWVTSNDNHLHKLSVNNARQILIGDKDEQDDRLKILIAKEELGLDANVLVVEDFNPVTELDTFSCKVLSCAKGGALIGVDSVDDIVKGDHYWIADGVNQELIQVRGVAYGVDYYRVTLEVPLTYDYNGAKLYRTTYHDKQVDKKSLSWIPRTVFKGIEANLEREIYADTTLANSAAIKIEGEGMVNSNGYMTLDKNFKGEYSHSEGSPGSEHEGGITYETVSDEEIANIFDGVYDTGDDNNG